MTLAVLFVSFFLKTFILIKNTCMLKHILKIAFEKALHKKNFKNAVTYFSSNIKVEK